MLGIEGLVARAGVGAGQQAQELVRSGAADDPLRIEREGLAERAAQRLAVAVRVAVQGGGGIVEGVERLRARSERALVRCQLDDAVEPWDGRLAADVGRDVEDPRAGDQQGHRAAVSSAFVWRTGRTVSAAAGGGSRLSGESGVA